LKANKWTVLSLKNTANWMLALVLFEMLQMIGNSKQEEDPTEIRNSQLLLLKSHFLQILDGQRLTQKTLRLPAVLYSLINLTFFVGVLSLFFKSRI
jgi:hypothetical protein